MPKHGPDKPLKIVNNDILIIGSGIAGLYTALKLAEHYKISLLSKDDLEETNTAHAQGGIAAAICPKDKPEYHYHDTILAGAGLCNESAVKILVNEGPARIEELVNWGVNFDRNPDNTLSLTREAAHSQRRILHANGDATGSAISSVLACLVKKNPNITIYEHCFVKDLIIQDETCCGALAVSNETALFTASATILATGGLGQLYSVTTNPAIATGDGFSLAYRAGCALTDLEFIQFHPTALKFPGAPAHLISESVRGEGGLLLNIHGEKFMSFYDPQAELAPRDIVSRAIAAEMEKTNAPHVFLDLTHWSSEKIQHRFPTVFKICQSVGLNPATDLIPVAPAAHYMMGGVYTDTNGQTTVPGLYACGEVACTGVHGANRLASNSLLEALVFGNRIAKKIAGGNLPRVNFHADFIKEHPACAIIQDCQEIKRLLQEKMTLFAGIKRNSQGLFQLKNWCEKTLASFPPPWQLNKESAEVYNMIQLASLISQAALLREESRGGHYREDFPEKSREWEKHIFFRKKEVYYG